MFLLQILKKTNLFCSVTFNCLVKSFKLLIMKTSHQRLEKVKKRFFETCCRWMMMKHKFNDYGGITSLLEIVGIFLRYNSQTKL